MEEQTGGALPVRERLILAGIHEINQNGVQNFSVRRVANECGVSCAAPYKHFKDKGDFFAAILDYITAQWRERKAKVLDKYPSGPRRQLAEVSLEYIRFLVECPQFRSVLMSRDEGIGQGCGHPQRQLSDVTEGLIGAYCRSAGMDERTRRLKTYVVRSLIYGAALMFHTGELEYNDENMSLVAYAIEREFDLV